jgi:hypothetical protein
VDLKRRTLSFALLLIAAAAAWTLLRPAGFEVAVLRTFGEGSDTFTSLWVLDDPGTDLLWVRAHRADRRWLGQLQADPQVELRRDGQSLRYVAQVFDDDASRDYVSAGFRKKYGLTDALRELAQRSAPVPVRLRGR